MRRIDGMMEGEQKENAPGIIVSGIWKVITS